MLPSYLLSLREGIEAALIVGIVLSALRQMNQIKFAPAVWAGVAGAAALSLIAAIVLTAFGWSLEGPAEPIFEGITMFLAAGVLTWMIFWMHSNSRQMKGELESGVRQALSTNGTRGLFALAFIAVFREGIELALFLTASVFASNPVETILGSLLGLFTAILLGWSLFATTVKLDLRRFFRVTGILLILFAAGLVAHGVHEFNEVGLIPSVIEHVWDINLVLDEKSTFGSILIALFGYNGNPSLTEVLAYGFYFVAIWLGLRTVNKPVTAVAQTQA